MDRFECVQGQRMDILFRVDADGVMSWVDPATVNTGSALPAGLQDETIYHDGTDWTSSTSSQIQEIELR